MGSNPQGTTKDSIQDVIRYYLDTGLDYGEWSREYNMHFGYFKWGMNPFRRERMLDEMNQQVFAHLQLAPEDKVVYDLGCGLGAPCRSFAKRFPEDLSFRVAPSVMHSPFTVLYFLIKKTLQGEKLNPVRLGHLKACLLGLVLGMHRGKFAYCLITGVRT